MFIINIFCELIYFIHGSLSRIGRCPPDHKPRLIFHVVNADRLHIRISAVMGLDLFHDDIAGIPPLVYDKMLDGRQGDLFHLREQGIVAPHHGHVPRHLIFLIMQGVQNPERNHIIEPYDGGQLLML